MHSVIEHLPLIVGTFGLSAAAWGAIGAVGGVGASIYGANKAAKSQQSAIDANLKAQEDANKLNYQRWLESQGVGPDGQPINTWLPRYAMVKRPTQLPAGFRIFGSSTPSLVASNVATNGVPNRAAAPSLSAMGGGSGGSIGGGPAYGELINSINNQSRIPNENAP